MRAHEVGGGVLFDVMDGVWPGKACVWKQVEFVVGGPAVHREPRDSVRL